MLNEDEILDIANDMAFMACIWIKDDSNEFKDMIHFAKLVANAASAKEREACANLCEDQAQEYYSDGSKRAMNYQCADAIRSRGEA